MKLSDLGIPDTTIASLGPHVKNILTLEVGSSGKSDNNMFNTV